MGIPILHFDFLFQAEEASRTFLEEEEEEGGERRIREQRAKGAKGRRGEDWSLLAVGRLS